MRTHIEDTYEKGTATYEGTPTYVGVIKALSSDCYI
jgi:hypothetical protein